MKYSTDPDQIVSIAMQTLRGYSTRDPRTGFKIELNEAELYEFQQAFKHNLEEPEED